MTLLQRTALMAMIFTLGLMPYIYGMAIGSFQNHWLRILLGPVAVLVSAALAGAAGMRLSKWWWLSLLAPFMGMMLMLTASA